MRIAQISTLATPVGQNNSGSIEGLVWLLSRELTRLGHDVTVFAAAGSQSHDQVVETLPGPYGANGSPGEWQVCEWINLCRAVEASDQFDLLHSHSYLYGLPLQRLSRAPMVHTLHLLGDEEFASLWSMYPDAHITAISRYQWSAFPQLKPEAIVHHGIDPALFTFNPQPEDYVCFLGRFTHEKGPLDAITAAKSLGLRLVLAGPGNAYYRERLEPLVDGKIVQYAGSVTGAERDRLLGGARALLYPLHRPEPFGLVMIEAMMCGTPVAAMNLGAVPEIIDEGVTGYFAETPEEYLEAVSRALTLDRLQVRARAEERFSAERMAREYINVYEWVVRTA